MRTSTAFFSPRRTGSGPAAALAAALLLAGCGGGGSGDDAGASESSASASSSSAAETQTADLASGLLPAESFGPEATVVAVPAEQLRAGAGLAAMGEDLQITPEACAAAVQGTQPDLDAYDDVAGVSASSGALVTVEMLLRGGPTEGVVDLLAGAAQRCPRATIASPQLGQVTVDFADVPVADLGDASAAMRYTTTVAMPDGTTATVPALVGAVEDGDRLVVLVSLANPAGGAPAPGSEPAPGGAPAAVDPAAFADLLEEAYEVQSGALG